MEQTSNQTALCILIPSDQIDWIQQIRMEKDKAFDRWPPHINLLFPFIPENEFEAALPKLKEVVGSVPKIHIKLSKTSHFQHGSRNFTMFLDPEEDMPGSIATLQDKVQELFPWCTRQKDVGDGVFVPHVTLGQFKSLEKIEEQTQWIDSMPVVEFDLTSIALIARERTTPFTVKYTIPLSEGSFSFSTSFVSSAPSTPSSSSTPKRTRIPKKKESDDATTIGTDQKITPTRTYKSSYYKDKPSPLTTPSPTSRINTRSSATQKSSPKSTDEHPTPTELKLEPPHPPAFKYSFQINSPTPLVLNTTFTSTPATAAGSSLAITPAWPKFTPIGVTSPSFGTNLTFNSDKPATTSKPKISSYYTEKKTKIGRDSKKDEQGPSTEGEESIFQPDTSVEFKDYPPNFTVIASASKSPPQVSDEVEQVSTKVEQWLISADPSKRPKNRTKLGNSISKMCSYTASPLTAHDAINQLKIQGYVSIAATKVTFLKKGEKSVQRMNAVYHSQTRFTSDSESALDRAINWVMDPDNVPKTEDALANALNQLLIVKKQISPSSVIQHLVEIGKITVLQDENSTEHLQYHL